MKLKDENVVETGRCSSPSGFDDLCFSLLSVSMSPAKRVVVFLVLILMMGTVLWAGRAENFMKGNLADCRQIHKVAIFGDSIMRSGFGAPVGKTTGEYTPDDGYQHLTRLVADYLLKNNDEFDEPVKRNVTHEDWTLHGAEVVGSNYPYGDNGDRRNDICVLADDNGFATLTAVTGEETIVFIFEGGSKDDPDYATGVAIIEARIDDGDGFGPWTSPSQLGLKGELTKRGFGDANVFAPAKDEFDTSFRYPETAYKPLKGGNGTVPCLELVYNGLNPKHVYEFRVKRKRGGDKPVRLFGAYAFTGKTLLVLNPSDPGKHWDTLRREVYNALKMCGVDWVIVEAPIYHDFNPKNEIKAYATAFINECRKWGIEPAVMSCPPGGWIVTGSPVQKLGTELQTRQPNMNFVKEFNHRQAVTIKPVSYKGYPDRGDVYEVVVNGKPHRIRPMLTKPDEKTFPRWFYRAALPFLIDEKDEDLYQLIENDEIAYPFSLKKISGSGADALTAVGRRYMPPRFDVHRDLIEDVCDEEDVCFIDVYEAFRRVAESVDETLESEGCPMDPQHPMFAYVDGRFRRFQLLFPLKSSVPEKNAVYVKTINDSKRSFKIESVADATIDGKPFKEVGVEMLSQTDKSPIYLGDIKDGVQSLWKGAVYAKVSGSGPNELKDAVGIRKYYAATAPIRMNYMSNFFSIGDGHHLRYGAHPVIFAVVRDQILKTSYFNNFRKHRGKMK